MVTDTSSWLKKTIGQETYNNFKGVANRCIPIASIIIIAVIALTQFFYWEWLSWILNLITGTSLIFIVYIVGLVVFLDKGIKIEQVNDPYRYDGYIHPVKQPKGYTATKIWGISLIFLAITAIYVTNEYRKHYAFNCETFLVDEDNGVYHLKENYDEYCGQHVTKMKGYQIEEHGYTLCKICDEWASDAEDYNGSERFLRR